MIHNLEQNCIDLRDAEDWFNKIDKLINLPLEECQTHEKQDQEESFYSIDDKAVLSKIKNNISVRLYHGCRIEDFDSYKKHGLKISDEDFNKNLLPGNIREKIAEEELKQAKGELNLFPKANSGTVYFCPTLESAIKLGGIYVIYGSEYRYRILTQLNKINIEEIFNSGVPSILAFDIPLNVINDNDNLLNSIVRFYYKKKLYKNNLINNTILTNYLEKFQKGQITSKSGIKFDYFKKIIFPKKIYVKNHFDSKIPSRCCINDICKKENLEGYYNFDKICRKEDFEKLKKYLKKIEVNFEILEK